jgi:hypothetical protein
MAMLCSFVTGFTRQVVVLFSMKKVINSKLINTTTIPMVTYRAPPSYGWITESNSAEDTTMQVQSYRYQAKGQCKIFNME